MNKETFIQIAFKHGIEARYDGKNKRFYMHCIGIDVQLDWFEDEVKDDNGLMPFAVRYQD